ncbi:hypothetical protein O1611_g958 [Lasiodiplodia mahajangana]|uniref:Uncharacterized protein n=1 Tax=Lasiodiplodia mahajangana TaxID=1108764 RepID=A0ACC2JYQ4_9PEZI|nr:hypothetical protein O1611_g958 [Lasiodiplodia mahajangana]
MASYLNRFRKTPGWVEGMQLPRGKPHDDVFNTRIRDRTWREVGEGTQENPTICWLSEYYRPESVSHCEAIEAIIRQQLIRYKLRFAWIVADGHAMSTVGRTKAGRIMSDDDNHITLRMGLTEDICNLHGHFYLIYEDNDPQKKAIRMMREDERSIVGGKNPQLWVMGAYPKQFQKAEIKYPTTPFEIVPGSIFDRYMEAYQNDTNKDQKNTTNKTAVRK